ncbi:CLUMA_CG020336, isoform A [Clunio marinus]|uniref:CLUMA_CG020336, isoform A n=1 Tax=Clunio marinus TaxID=568069 RepID=A0A1J1J7B4_9DIPT|nr:CLUMA_CG020336, isoform A [Clunio marinus]
MVGGSIIIHNNIRQKIHKNLIVSVKDSNISKTRHTTVASKEEIIVYQLVLLQSSMNSKQTKANAAGNDLQFHREIACLKPCNAEG